VVRLVDEGDLVPEESVMECEFSVPQGQRPVDWRGRTECTLALVEQLVDVVNTIEELHPGRKFTLDGHLVGSIGEAAAEALFAITLATASTAGYDAVAEDGRRVEIKATFGTGSVAVRPTSGAHADAALIVLRLSKVKGLAHEIVYNGPISDVIHGVVPSKSNGQASIRLSRLRKLDLSVPDTLRVPRRTLPSR
jgi:hypothetical protein